MDQALKAQLARKVSKGYKVPVGLKARKELLAHKAQLEQAHKVLREPAHRALLVLKELQVPKVFRVPTVVVAACSTTRPTPVS